MPKGKNESMSAKDDEGGKRGVEEREGGTWQAVASIVAGVERITVVAKFITSASSSFSSLLEYSVAPPLQK